MRQRVAKKTFFFLDLLLLPENKYKWIYVVDVYIPVLWCIHLSETNLLHKSIFLSLFKTLLVFLLDPGTYTWGPVFPTRLSLDGRLWKIARLTPVFLWFCPSICNFGHVHEQYWAVWQTGQQRFQCALNHKKDDKITKTWVLQSLCARLTHVIFVQKAPVFLQK